MPRYGSYQILIWKNKFESNLAVFWYKNKVWSKLKLNIQKVSVLLKKFLSINIILKKCTLKQKQNCNGNYFAVKIKVKSLFKILFRKRIQLCLFHTNSPENLHGVVWYWCFFTIKKKFQAKNMLLARDIYWQARFSLQV